MDDAKWGQTLEGDKADETPVSEGKKITFISSNVNVATVTGAGKVTGKKKGQCVIYCITHNGINKNVNVTVKKAKKK